ncbi:MAG: TIGR00180 family glycosyltransferase [Acidobacteria bacterium]|nr:TIGR00180 family glycosyltransferase [Acidobacteriota bacterium]
MLRRIARSLAYRVRHLGARLRAEADARRVRPALLAEVDEIVGAPPDSLTVLIPSKDREAALGALLQYYADAGLKYRILVLESGSRYRALIDRYPLLDIELIEFHEQTAIQDKLQKGLASVRTPLVAMCTDDDITTHEGLKKAGGFLVQHPEYSACQGYHVLFSAAEKFINLISIAYFTPSLDQPDPLGRVNALIRRYQPVCWAVFRTPTMVEAAATFSRASLLLFYELLWSATAAINGKVKRLPMIYCLRRIDYPHLSANPLYAVMESPQGFFADYLAYRNILVERIGPGVACSRAELAHILDVMHACYFGRETNTGILGFFTDKLLNRPSASVYDPGIVEVIRPPLPRVDTGWSREIARNERAYRLFPAFIDAEPKSEIHLRCDFIDHLIADLDRYPLNHEAPAP